MRIFDATGAIITINSSGQPVNPTGNIMTVITADGFANGWASQTREILQPDMLTLVSTLINFITYQAVRDQAPTTNLKFSRTPDSVNRKIPNSKTNAGKDIYN